MTSDFPAPFLKKLYFQMLRIRRVEEKVSELYREGHIVAPVHLSTGQEAVTVGIMAALRPQDRIVATHRCHGHFLSKGGDLKKMISELCGKETGCARGHGGTMHLFDIEAGLIASVPIIGASIPFAVGIALASQMRGRDIIAAAFFGDGAVEEGVFWESLNFASVQKLPVLFVCENNLYATHSHISSRQPVSSIAERVRPHDLFAMCVEDGQNVRDVYAAARMAVREMRIKPRRPAFLEVCTYRYIEHWGVDDDRHLGYRSEAEVKEWIARDPIEICRKFLVENLNVSAGEFQKMENEIAAELDEAVQFAENSPAPTINGGVK